MDEAKEDMIDVVKFLRNPEVFRQVGAKIPKGQMKVMTKVIMEVKKFFITQYSIVFSKLFCFHAWIVHISLLPFFVVS